MTLQDLKDQLENLCEYYEDSGVGAENIKVKVGIQQNYPLRASLSHICTEHRTNEDKDDVIWLAISDGIDYSVPHDIWEEDDIYKED